VVPRAIPDPRTGISDFLAVLDEGIRPLAAVEVPGQVSNKEFID